MTENSPNEILPHDKSLAEQTTQEKRSLKGVDDDNFDSDHLYVRLVQGIK